MPTYTTGYQNNQRVRVVVDITTNHASNTSTVRVRQYQDRSSGYIASSDWEMFTSLDGSTLHNSTQYRSINSTLLISDNTRTISHANNGQRTVRVLARSWTHATSLFRQEIDRTITLTTIDTRPAPLGQPALAWSGTTLTVTAPVADAPAPIQNYQIRHQTRLGNGAWSGWVNGTISSSRVETYTPAAMTDYRFQARASTAGGWGSWGSTRSFLVPRPPSAPTVARSGTELTVTSGTPSSDEPIQNYHLRYREGAGSWVTASVQPERVWTLTANPGHSYELETRASSSNGWGSWGSTRSFSMPDTPGAPSSVSLTADVRDLTAAWPQPGNGGDAITRYETQIRNLTTGGGWTDLRDTGLTRSVTYEGLQPGSEYEVQVRAVNSVGAGDWRVSAPIRINAYGNRRTTSGWVPVSHAYRRTPTGWVPISRIRRWTGTAWVDVT